MPRAGRPERPIDTASGPLPLFAGELRRLRGNQPYRELAAKTGLSITSLRNAAAGESLPTWQVTRAFVTVCGGDLGAIWEFWKGACIAGGRLVPSGRPPAEPPIPSSAELTDALQFISLMKLLRLWAGSPSLAELNRRSRWLLPPSTLSEVLRKQQLPRLDLVQAYVRACGLTDEQCAAWEQSWTALEMRQYSPPRSRRAKARPASTHRTSSARASAATAPHRQNGQNQTGSSVPRRKFL
jgi:hypothetical protein